MVHPIFTVGRPCTMAPPWAVPSPMRAAGRPLMKTVVDPPTIRSGGPLQAAISPMRVAGRPPKFTLGDPIGPTGPPTCGVSPLYIGQMCISPKRAAGDPIIQLILTGAPFNSFRLAAFKLACPLDCVCQELPVWVFIFIFASTLISFTLLIEMPSAFI